MSNNLNLAEKIVMFFGLFLGWLNEEPDDFRAPALSISAFHKQSCLDFQDRKI